MSEIAILPSREEFRALARAGNVIPVFAELIADSETPVSAFQKIDDGGASFLFESAEKNEESGRFSFLGVDSHLIIQSYGRSISIAEGDHNHTFETSADPLAELEKILARFRFVTHPALPHFAGGAVGFIGYDIARFFEPSLPEAGTDDLRLPEMVFMIAKTLVVFDHRLRRLRIIANAFIDADEQNIDQAYEAATNQIRETIQKLDRPAGLRGIDAKCDVTPPATRSNATRAEFEAMVDETKEHIAAGDIFQAVLSQRFETEFARDPLDLYRCLRFINPSPYMFCLKFGDGFSLVGSSPELHVRATDGLLQIRPIAGTRPRGKTRAEDERNAEELLADPKERAEHVMLIDLGRNDLGRVAEFGSVRVTEKMAIERYSHVMHIVSHVIGRLRADKNVFDVIRATFPAGTVSGAPKVRAMQIIAGLEKSKRGFYAGAVGYFGFDGKLDCCIALRSVVLKNGKAYVQAGAGIVADSDPASEYQETVNKAMAMIQAVARANEIGR